MSSAFLTTALENESFRIEKKFTHKWTIHNFYCQRVGHGEVLPSTKFKFNFGAQLKFTGDLSLEGQRCSERICKLSVECRTQQLWQVYVKLWIGERMPDCLSIQFLNQSTKYVVMNITDYYNRQCQLSTGKAIIMCEVTYMDYVEGLKPTYTPVREFEISHNFGELYESKKFADLTLVVSGHELRAHKCVLASRSRVFAAMLEEETEENNSNQLTIPDIDVDVFEEILRYIYTNEVCNLSEMASQLITASDVYELDILKSMCEYELAKRLSVTTAAEILIFADASKATNLKEHAINFIRSNSQGVVTTEGWQNIIDNYCYLLPEIFLQLNQ